MDDDGTSMKNEEKTNRYFIMFDAISIPDNTMKSNNNDTFLLAVTFH